MKPNPTTALAALALLLASLLISACSTTGRATANGGSHQMGAQKTGYTMSNAAMPGAGH